MDFADRDGVIWQDGALVPWREAKIHVLTHSLHYGMAVFEGIRAYKTERGPALFRLEDHTRRLFKSAHILNMTVPFDQDTINEAQCTLLRENALQSAYVRPIFYYGSEGMGLHTDALTVHASVAAWEWGAYLGAENLERGIRVKTSSYTRHHVHATMSKAKASGNYINSILALHEAQACGYDEALMLDVDGYVAEGSGENIFVVHKERIYTPDLTAILEGITRDTILALAAELDIPVYEKRITRDELYVADEAFFTGTAAEVTPIREVDGRTIGDGRRGTVTEKLQTMYFDQVQGRREVHPEWLTYP